MNKWAFNIKFHSDLLQDTRNYLLKKGFIEIKTPKISFIPTDQDDHLFKVDYFKSEAYLIQSPQFYKQAYVLNGIDSVFEIGPVFRAEPRVTKRHLSEFNSLDIESSKFVKLDDLLEFEKKLLKEISQDLAQKYNLISPLNTFDIITYREIKKALNLKDSEPIGNLHEKEISNYFNKDGIFIIEYSSDERVFYYKENNGISLSYDLIVRGLEITSGGVRETHKREMIDKMKDNNINPLKYKQYLALFDKEVVPHGGFGLGIERFISRLLDYKDVGNILPYSKKPNTIKEHLKWK